MTKLAHELHTSDSSMLRLSLADHRLSVSPVLLVNYAGTVWCKMLENGVDHHCENLYYLMGIFREIIVYM